MNVVVHPGTLRGSVRVPPSKSMAHRALIAAALADGLTTLHLGGPVEDLSADIEATIDVLMALGAMIDADLRRGLLIVRPIEGSGLQNTAVCSEAPSGQNDGVAPPVILNEVKDLCEARENTCRKTGRQSPCRPIEGAPGLRRTLSGLAGKAASHVDYAGTLELDCGESGSTLRFLLPVACALGAKARFTGHGRLPLRPNAPLVSALTAHGAQIDRDALPMNIAGILTGGAWTLPGDVSSQYVTGLLLALPLLAEDSAIALTTPLQSASYVEMTLQALREFGIAVEEAPEGWRVPGNQVYRSPEDVYIEGDWSAAAFWHAANAMGADIDATGVSRRSAQGDRAVVDLLGKPEIDARNVPDLVPALAAAAATLPQRTVITGAARLRLKESDRLQAVADMLHALGGRAEVTPDGLIIEGVQSLHGGTVDGCNDHRIVMAAAILATRAGGPVTITGAEAVNKSYPDFFDHFRQLGGSADVEPAGRQI